MRNSKNLQYDCVVIGGGFYGAVLALYMKQRVDSVLLVEREGDLMQHASFVNQARVHNGYHYPRSIVTALRSRVNLPLFIKEYSSAVVQDFTKLYAIAKKNSKVNSRQFEKFCSDIGAVCEPAAEEYMQYFDDQYIESVFEVQEYAFDADRLREIVLEQLSRAGVELLYDTEVTQISQMGASGIEVECTSGITLTTHTVINATYSHINTILRDSKLPLLQMKHEITELTLVEVPDELKSIGITVMDGPFFSIMPFPARDLHSFTHVRYTPHESWIDNGTSSIPTTHPYTHIDRESRRSNFPHIVRDAQRYIPLLSDVIYRESLYETKTVLLDNEKNDGRPILYRSNYGIPGHSVVMGGKIDNIYDIFAAMDAQGV